ncbi:MAG: hypothetical protein HYS34_07380 [Acidobacteria bacterium]|nr:hypothetical protein [Acidobacteriota bacterium]
MHRNSLAVPRVMLSALLGLLASVACGPREISPLGAIEAAYQDARYHKDRIDVTRARGAEGTPDGATLPDLIARYRAARATLQKALASVPPEGPGADDRRALEVIKRTFEKDLGEEQDPGKPDAGPAAAPGGAGTAAPAAGTQAPDGGAHEADCAYVARALAEGPDGMRVLSDRMYACFGEAARNLVFEGQTLDRLTVFSLLPVTDDPARRKKLFLAMQPVWRSINGDGGPESSFRHLVRLSAAKRGADKNPVEAGAGVLGIDPGAIEGWLTAVLEKWREITPDRIIEPWDFAYEAGRASRTLRAAIPLEVLKPANDRFYHDLGAEVAALGIQYDLLPRDGKDPVAFTTFGARPRHKDGTWVRGEPWVFAAYRVGSIDNLNELLHETGHAIHIAAIRTRPAFMDWPDSDLFTEGIADIAALEIFEPAWQRKYLGTSVPLADSLRAKYAGIVMDVAWTLFEIRMHRTPGADPNDVWSDITGRYFRVRPHPELSWWAARGQLINLPGYMLNYAVGAILVADLRARAKDLHGAYTEGDPSWYGWVSERLYRFGLERPSRQVIEDFLGRPVSPRALLEDLGRAGGP